VGAARPGQTRAYTQQKILKSTSSRAVPCSVTCRRGPHVTRHSVPWGMPLALRTGSVEQGKREKGICLSFTFKLLTLEPRAPSTRARLWSRVMEDAAGQWTQARSWIIDRDWARLPLEGTPWTTHRRAQRPRDGQLRLTDSTYCWAASAQVDRARGARGPSSTLSSSVRSSRWASAP
jgi:hypothetical protein